MDDDQQALRTAATIRRGAVRLSRRLRGARSRGALSGTKVGVLGHLHQRGPSSPGAIAAAEQLRPQALTRVFAELEADGLIRRTPSAQDGRGATLGLTDAGADVLLADMAERDQWLAGALGTLSETEVGVLRLAGRLMDRLADLDSTP